MRFRFDIRWQMPKAPSAPRQQAKDREKSPKTVTQGFRTGSKTLSIPSCCGKRRRHHRDFPAIR